MANASKCGIRSTIPRRSAGITALVAAVLLVASCSSSVSTSDGTTTSGAVATTVAGATTTEASSSPSVDVTEADLEALLPVAADLGSGYRLVETDDADDDGDVESDGEEESSEMDKAMEAACPAFREFADDDADDDDPEAERSFESVDDDGRTIDVNVATGIKNSKIGDPEALQKAVDAVNDCDIIDMKSDGIRFTGKLSMEADDSRGDFGGVLRMEWRGESDQLPRAIEINAIMYMFAIGDIGVTISALGGMDSATLASVPPDVDIVEKLLDNLEKSVGALS